MATPHKDPTVLIAADSFKGSASSKEVGTFIEEGIRRVAPQSSCKLFSIADGGEGTIDALVSACGGSIKTAQVSAPLGNSITARYGMLNSHEAVVEAAESSGITLMELTPAHALEASSLGLGQIILDAINAGAERILVGLGGSATSDGGVGMAKALGVRFLTKDGSPIPCGLEGLQELASIDCSRIPRRVRETEFIILNDVTNPLTGPEGAIAVYGPQKGLDRARLNQFDHWMEHYAQLMNQVAERDVNATPGAGAAGGLGAAFMAFFNAKMVRGIDYVLDRLHLDEAMEGIDLVITGEGRMDWQSAFHKAPVGVAQIAQHHNIPTIAIVGSRAYDLGEVYTSGIRLVIPCVVAPSTLEECLSNVATTIPLAAETAMRAFLLSRLATKASVER